MKVFISWSGPRSKDMANALRDWLPMVLQYVEPFVSDKDISAGDRWAQTIASELEAANFGIICITPENLTSEWVLFESGALSKSMLDGKVIPLLFGLEMSDLSGPLKQFQAQKVEEAGIMEVVKAINSVAEGKADDKIIDRTVPALWPQLETALESIPDIAPAEKHRRPQNEILEEIVTDVRGLNSRVSRLGDEVSERESVSRPRKRRYHLNMMVEFAMMTSDLDDAPTSLLVLAGFLRDDFPWLAEVLTESYREIRVLDIEEREMAFHRLQSVVTKLIHHPTMLELSYDSKEGIKIAEELPVILDMAIGRMRDRSQQQRPSLTTRKRRRTATGFLGSDERNEDPDM
ncbi:toll/interleukin-1 receptor domain-containing protein [Ruegeria meonggei]|uniref:toll/interleukin-1 receptor domain-containing protein n=1 Tax=Ruegeria meonggei TaxID=1446476 RepID=UPI00367321D4